MMNVQPVSCSGGHAQLPSAGGRRSQPSGIGLDAIADALADGLARLLHAIPLWYDRIGQRHHLMGLDDRMLRDIGVSRAAAVAEFDKPFWRG